MLTLDKIIITQFKNYNQSAFVFDQDVVGICGLNGKGKTNLLDAIYYCCFTKSYFSSADAMNIGFGKDGFRLEGFFRREGKVQKVTCINRGGTKKEFLLNNTPYEKFSKHIGLLPAVMIAPDDVELITGKSENRRKYLDTIISQVDTEYLQQLISYNKILQQRNGLLKRMEEEKKSGGELLEILDEQLLAPGNYIHRQRALFLQKLIPLVCEFYHMIAEDAETINLHYISQLTEQPFDQLLKQSRQKDILLQRSNAGVHKDDMSMELNGQPFKNIASQGQRKSLLFSLKLAEFEMLKESKGFAPLLLLDDVFEKLDSRRMQQLLHWVCKKNTGQVFITDTHRVRLEEAFDSLDVEFQLIEL